MAHRLAGLHVLQNKDLQEIPNSRTQTQSWAGRQADRGCWRKMACWESLCWKAETETYLNGTLGSRRKQQRQKGRLRLNWEPGTQAGLRFQNCRTQGKPMISCETGHLTLITWYPHACQGTHPCIHLLEEPSQVSRTVCKRIV